MTGIRTSVAFVLLLLAAMAAVAAPLTAPSQPQISPLCGAGAPLLAPITLPDRDRIPEPVPLLLTCGVCSAAACVGARDGSTCSGGTQPMHCYIESNCTQGGQYCICATEPF